ncbi:MAG: Lar family restriction alleviation protein [Synergistaceae bacterium]|nr:Lar family restriction alleviation protein [Synergistaceae bacterium]
MWSNNRSEIKHCPFCDNHAIEARKFGLINRIGIYCDICGAVVFFGDECSDINSIIKKWNKRPEV